MTRVFINNVQRLRYQEMLSTELNTDDSGTLGNYVDIPFVEDSVTLELQRPMVSPGYARQRRDQHPEEVHLPQSWKLTLSINLTTPTSRATDGQTIETTPAGRFLKLTMGGEKLAIGDTVKAASSPTYTVIAATTIARFEVGQIIGFKDTSNVLHLREVASISGDNITLKLGLPFVPSPGDDIYGIATYYLDNYDSNDVCNAQFILEGLGITPDFEDSWVLLGGQILTPITIEMPNNGIPKATFVFEGLAWGNGDAAAMTPAALGVASYSNVTNLLVADCYHMIPTVGASTYGSVTRNITTLNLIPNWFYVKHESSGGTNGVAAYVMNGDHPKISANFDYVYDDQEYYNAWHSKTPKAYFYQIGSSSTTGAILVSMPTTQITDVQMKSMGGLRGQNVTLKGRLDSDTTQVTETAMGVSPIRIGIG